MSDERHAGRELSPDELEDYVMKVLEAVVPDINKREEIARAVAFHGTVAEQIFQVGRQYEREYGAR